MQTLSPPHFGSCWSSFATRRSSNLSRQKSIRLSRHKMLSCQNSIPPSWFIYRFSNPYTRRPSVFVPQSLSFTVLNSVISSSKNGSSRKTNCSSFPAASHTWIKMLGTRALITHILSIPFGPRDSSSSLTIPWADLWRRSTRLPRPTLPPLRKSVVDAAPHRRPKKTGTKPPSFPSEAWRAPGSPTVGAREYAPAGILQNRSSC